MAVPNGFYLVEVLCGRHRACLPRTCFHDYLLFSLHLPRIRLTVAQPEMLHSAFRRHAGEMKPKNFDWFVLDDSCQLGVLAANDNSEPEHFGSRSAPQPNGLMDGGA
jgi:hypothetical protein